MKHEKLSQKHEKWIIEFYSEKHSKPIFFIWLTDVSDKNGKDQFLVNQSQKIIVGRSKKRLIKSVLKSKTKLPDSKRTKKWLRESLKCKKISSITFDLRGIESKILSKQLEESEIAQIINFINLFEDYKRQLGKQKGKLKSRTKQLAKIWGYYYEQIFFPNFNKTNDEEYHPVALQLNNKKLLKEFSYILEDFERKFKFIKK